MHYVLFYEVRNDYVEKRAQFRELHLKLARAAAHDRGELMRRDMVRRPPYRSAGSKGEAGCDCFRPMDVTGTCAQCHSSYHDY
ncbi:MAG TPA: hypothetical protein VH024_02455 [Candidatus Angelobacter sp.]|nr:hypothetical protein [Candidatus Angelobacter sp.]